MLLSVVMPVYNAEKWLEACLDSVLAAGVGDCEILLVDDGSTDESPAIEDEYARRFSQIRVLRQENAGPSAARNAGLRASRGDFVAFLDSDDRVIPEAFGKTVSLLSAHEADFWVSDFFRVADNGAVLDRIEQIAPCADPAFGSEVLRRYLTSGDCVWNVWRCVFRRRFLEENGLRFREGFHCGEDLEFMVRALTATERIAFFHNPYYCYRVNYGATLTRRYTAERVRQLMEMLQSAGRRLDGDAGETAAALRRMLAREYLLNLSLYAECPRAQRREALGYLRTAQSLGCWAAGAYRPAALFARIFGITLTARLLLGLKRVKRLSRRIKQKGGEHFA